MSDIAEKRGHHGHRSSADFDWEMLDRIHGNIRQEVLKGEMGFDYATYADDTTRKFESPRALANYVLDFGDENGVADFEAYAEFLSKIFQSGGCTYEKAKEVLMAYQTQMAPELVKQGKCHVRKGTIAWLYFAPIKTLAEKMSLMFRLADANNDGFLSRNELSENVQLFLGNAAAFTPQIQTHVGEVEANLFVGMLNQVYTPDRIQYMVDQVFETAKTDDQDRISEQAWDEWCQSPENLAQAFGRAANWLYHDTDAADNKPDFET